MDRHRLITFREIVARRELEQEEAIVEADELGAPPCRLCGKRVHMTELPQLTVCTGCGGRKKEAQLQRKDAEEFAAHQRQRQLVALATGDTMESGTDSNAEAQACVTCGRGVRSRNGITQTQCFKCRSGIKPPAPGEAAAPLKAKGHVKELEKRFRIVAEAVGEDPDELVACFFEGWLKRLRELSARDDDAP
jgi:ribosomal protein L37AE/L43A